MDTQTSQAHRRTILIVGGGAAGWLTAAYLARTLGTEAEGGPRITLLESPDIGIVGVGEGTFPTIRTLLRDIGIDEAEFMRESHATFKQGIRFEDWETTPNDGDSRYFVHPFEAPYSGREDLNLTPYWLSQDSGSRPAFADAVTFQTQVAQAGLAPKRLHQGHYAGPLNYAYHLDARRFADLLSRHARGLGVHHLTGTVNAVALDAEGAIAHVATAEHGDLTGDLYLDCTGFRAELIGKALQTPFRPIADILFTDRAVTCHAAYPRADYPLESCTVSAAREAGWIWDIGLATRRGVGYVYSSRHSDDRRAEEVLRDYIARTGGNADAIETRMIPFEAGYRTQHWVKNCVAVGLSAGFLEPLEATGMVLIETAISKIAEFFPHHGPVDASAHLFNDQMTRRYDAIIGFIKLHYCLTKRSEPFWRDNVQPDTVPDRLHGLLDLWKFRPPARSDFILDYESFAFFNYQYILYGMNYATTAPPRMPMQDKAEQIFARIQGFGEQARRDLIPHRAVINAIYAGGFMERAAAGR